MLNNNDKVVALSRQYGSLLLKIVNYVHITMSSRKCQPWRWMFLCHNEIIKPIAFCQTSTHPNTVMWTLLYQLRFLDKDYGAVGEGGRLRSLRSNNSYVIIPNASCMFFIFNFTTWIDFLVFSSPIFYVRYPLHFNPLNWRAITTISFLCAVIIYFFILCYKCLYYLIFIAKSLNNF
jgi:hypothetical protein